MKNIGRRFRALTVLPGEVFCKVVRFVESGVNRVQFNANKTPAQ